MDFIKRIGLNSFLLWIFMIPIFITAVSLLGKGFIISSVKPSLYTNENIEKTFAIIIILNYVIPILVMNLIVHFFALFKLYKNAGITFSYKRLFILEADNKTQKGIKII